VQQFEEVIIMALKLKTNETLALKSLKDALLKKYHVLDFRVFGSKIKGPDMPDSDIDVMIELAEYDSSIASEIDDVIFDINLSFDAFISAVIFGKKEIEEGPLSESPIYKMSKREGVSL
jgi:predicted nucleotidyltransferase